MTVPRLPRGSPTAVLSAGRGPRQCPAAVFLGRPSRARVLGGKPQIKVPFSSQPSEATLSTGHIANNSKLVPRPRSCLQVSLPRSPLSLRSTRFSSGSRRQEPLVQREIQGVAAACRLPARGRATHAARDSRGEGVRGLPLVGRIVTLPGTRGQPLRASCRDPCSWLRCSVCCRFGP